MPNILHPRLFLGTSSWSSKDWEGVFYPPGTAPADYLSHYATRYRSVEVDSSFYRPPTLSMTRRWRQALPEGFLMAAKVPRVITHEKGLVDCAEDLAEFLSSMDHLEDRLGPLLFQFPYYNKASGVTVGDFLERLGRFLPALPDGYRFALEVRNKHWLDSPLTDLLREHGVALTLIDHPWMPPVDALMDREELLTSNFCYVRWLGDRHGIERVTKNWDRLIVDRSRDTGRWAPAVRGLLENSRTVFGYFNNHYAGHAPGSISLFEETWKTLSPSYS